MKHPTLRPPGLEAANFYWTQEIDRSLHPNGFKGHPGKPYFSLRRARNAWSWWENLMVILRCQMFPPSSFRDSTHETSVLIFEIPNKNPFNFFILEDKHISKHHFETRGIYRFNLPVRKRKVGCQLFITTRAISCEGQENHVAFWPKLQ